MGTRTRLPAGCYGFQTVSGEEINGRPGGVVELEDHQVEAVRGSAAYRNGIIDVSMASNIGTKRGRECSTAPECLFVAQVWSDTCPRCGAPTKEAHKE